MKDYTEYNFAAIVGAEVEITTKNGETVRGTLIDFNFNLVEAPIYIHESGTCVAKIPLAEIKSLSAKIKVEDMSLKQYIRFMENKKFRPRQIRRKQHRFQNEDGCLCLYFLDAYIDCTEWGWKE